MFWSELPLNTLPTWSRKTQEVYNQSAWPLLEAYRCLPAKSWSRGLLVSSEPFLNKSHIECQKDSSVDGWRQYSNKFAGSTWDGHSILCNIGIQINWSVEESVTNSQNHFQPNFGELISHRSIEVFVWAAWKQSPLEHQKTMDGLIWLHFCVTIWWFQLRWSRFLFSQKTNSWPNFFGECW